MKASFPDRDDLRLVAQDHHERFDGSGYPSGKRGDEISLWGRIAAIADVYDAVTSKRCCGIVMSPHEAVSLIFHLGGEDFESLCVEKFIECVGIYPIGSLVRLSTHEVGLVVSVCHEDLLHPEVLLLYQGGRRLMRPRRIDLRDFAADGVHERRIEDILRPEDFGVEPARHILEQ